MKDTGFVVPPDKLHRLPVTYQKNQQTGKLEVWDPTGEASFFARPHGFPGAHGGLVSTVDDYCAFAQMMLNKGKVGNRQVLSAESVLAMMTDHVPQDVKTRSLFVPGFWDLRGWGYALSIIRKIEAGEPRGFGWDGGYGTVAYWDSPRWSPQNRPMVDGSKPANGRCPGLGCFTLSAPLLASPFWFASFGVRTSADVRGEGGGRASR